MSRSDQWVTISLAAFILVHITIWLVGYFTNKLSYLFPLINAAAAILIISYWALNEMHIQQHFIESREIIVLSFEVIVAIISIYSIFFNAGYNWLKVLQYIIFGIHLSAFTAILIFMLAFKINNAFLVSQYP